MSSDGKSLGRGCVKIKSLRTEAEVRAAACHNVREVDVPHALKMPDGARHLHGKSRSADDVCAQIIDERGGKEPSKREAWAYEVLLTAPAECLTSPQEVDQFFTLGTAWIRRHCPGTIYCINGHLDEQVAHIQALAGTYDLKAKKAFFAKWARRWQLADLQTSFAKEVGAHVGFKRGVGNTQVSYVRTKEFREHILAAESMDVRAHPEDVPEKGWSERYEDYRQRVAGAINQSLDKQGLQRIRDQAQAHIISSKVVGELRDTIEARDKVHEVAIQKYEARDQQRETEKAAVTASYQELATRHDTVLSEVTSTLMPQEVEQVVGGDAEIYPVIGTVDKPAIPIPRPKSPLERIMAAVPCSAVQAYQLLRTQCGEKVALAELHAALALNPALLIAPEVSAPVRVPVMDYTVSGYFRTLTLTDHTVADRLVNEGRIWADARGRVIVPHLTPNQEIKGWTAVDSQTNKVNARVHADEPAGIWFGDPKSDQVVLTGDIGLAIQAHNWAPHARVVCLPPSEHGGQKIFSDHCLRGRHQVSILKDENTPAETIAYLEGVCRDNECRSSVVDLAEFSPAPVPTAKRPLGSGYDAPFTSIPDDEPTGPGL